jgi:hypothetical protein
MLLWRGIFPLHNSHQQMQAIGKEEEAIGKGKEAIGNGL